MSDPVKTPPKPQTKTIDTYRKTDVLTANKETILLMLYAGAIRFLKKGMESAEQNDNAERNRWIMRVQEIVNELRATLNHEVGGELADNLDGLYSFITKNLSETMMENKNENMKIVLNMLVTLNEGWEQANENVKKERAKEISKENP